MKPAVDMKKNISTRELTTISFFVVITIIFAQIAIPLPFTPMPISLGIVAVYISAILQKPKNAVLTQICYLLIGVTGIPVFGEFRGGINALFGLTGGYLMTYPIVAGIVSAFLHNYKTGQSIIAKNQKVFIFKASLIISISQAVLYLNGTIWFSLLTGVAFNQALIFTVYPFILPDIIKIFLCIIICVPLRFRKLTTNFQ